MTKKVKFGIIGVAATLVSAIAVKKFMDFTDPEENQDWTGSDEFFTYKEISDYLIERGYEEAEFYEATAKWIGPNNEEIDLRKDSIADLWLFL